MLEFKKKLILLHHCKSATWKSIQDILRFDPSLSRMFQWTGSELQKNLYLKPSQIHNILREIHAFPYHTQFNLYENNNLKIITIFDDEYPEKLRNIHTPPWVLYGKGDFSLLKNKNMLAVVGSRNPSSYGKSAIKQVIEPLINKGFTIISGLAKGIDLEAHIIAIREKGKTIGILGGGIFHLYPKENIPYALEMMKNHLVFSEYPPFTKPEPWMFAARNRLISGVSDGILIVEAKEKSGTLITVNYALEQGKEVFALPGNITSELSKGANFLIQEGAKLVLSATDIENEFY
ncbi:DNA-processing protein DprA [Peribacillus tepidiphilus]|uniref:DNA-processing protein DprA n=1 Tax=Peribacillus tepidiphilus TaxID=2652445 RepID=UPI0035B52BE4